MKMFMYGVAATLTALAAAVAGIGFSGAVDVAADSPHSAPVHALIETFRERALDRATENIPVPADLADNERIRRGAGNYAAMCADCHLTPGVENSEIRKGLYPQPPKLTVADPDGSAAQVAARQFWVIKHGIKASGMAAWGLGGVGDGSIWDMVAFLGKLPSLDAAQYKALVRTSDGHSH